jgi:hypothetical protein
MQKHSKCIIFLFCLQISIINILYANTILKPMQAGYLLGKVVLWRVYNAWQFFQPVIWRVADLPAFAFDAFS